MSISSNYLANYSDENKLQKSVAVKVNSDKNISNQDVQKIVQSIFAQRADLNSIKSITIQFGGDKATYSVNNEQAQEITDDMGNSVHLESNGNRRIVAQAKNDVRVINISTQAFKEQAVKPKDYFVQKGLSLKETYRGLCESKTTSTLNAPLKFVASIALAPVALFNFLISPKAKSTENLPGELQSKNDMIKLLQAQQEVFNVNEADDPNVKKFGKNFGINAQMEEALKLAKMPLSDRNQREELAFQSAADILARFSLVENKIETKQEVKTQVNLAIIPAGFWKDGVYQSSLIAISRNEEGKLCLSEITFGDKQGMYVRDFIWDKTPNENQLANLISTFLEQANALKPSDSSNISAKTMQKAELISKLGDYEPPKPVKPQGNEIVVGGIKVPVPNIPVPEQGNGEEFESIAQPHHQQKKEDPHQQKKEVRMKGIEELRENVVVMAGAKPVAANAQRRELVRQDPWKFLHEAIRTQFPEVPFADKAVFAIGVLNHKLKEVVNDWEGLSKTEKKEWIKRLNNDYDHLVRQMEMQGLNSADLQKIDIFEKFRNSLNELSKKLPSDWVEKEIDARQAVFDKVVVAEPTLQIAKVKAESVAGGTEKPPSALTAQDIDRAYQVGQIVSSANLSSEDIQELKKECQSLAERMDSLVANGKYEEAKELYKIAVRNLPPPGGEVALWKALKANDGEIEGFSKSLAAMSKNFWEAKLKSNDVPLHPSEWVDMRNVEVGLLYMLEMKKNNIVQRIRDAGTVISDSKERFGEIIFNDQGDLDNSLVRTLCELNFTFDEICLLGKAGNFNKFYAYEALLSFKNMPYFRPGINPNLDKKIEGMRNYFMQKMGKDSLDEFEKGSTLGVNSDYKNEIRLMGSNVCDEASQIWRVMNPTQGLQEFGTLQFSYSNNGNEPHLPSQFVDFSRHQVMQNTLINFETAFFEPQTDVLSADNENRVKNPLHAPESLVKKTNYKMVASPEFRMQRMENFKKNLAAEGRLDLVAVNKTRSNGSDIYLGIGRAGQGENKPIVLVTRHAQFANSHPGEFIEFKNRAKGEQVPFREWSRLGDANSNNLVNAVNRNINVDVGYKLGTFQNALQLEGNFGTSENGLALDAVEFAWGDNNDDKLSPVEVYDLSALEVSGGEYKTHVPVSTGINALLYVINNPEKLSNPIIRNRIMGILGHQGLIKELVTKNPEALLKIAEMLNVLANDSLDKKATDRFVFILQVSSLLHNNLLQISEASAPQNEALNKMPSPSKLFAPDSISGSDLLLSIVNNPSKSESQRLDAAVTLLNHFATLPNSNRPIEMAELKGNPKLVSNLIIAAQLVKNNESNVQMPILADVGVRWVREVLAPAVFASSTDGGFRNGVLNEWMSTQEKQQPVVWSRGTGKQEGLWVGGGHEISPSELKIVTVNGKKSQGALPTLPAKIHLNPAYIALFGDQIFHARITQGKTPAETVYEFQDDSGVKYRIVQNTSKEEIFIDRQISSSLTGKEKTGWYRWSGLPEDREQLKGIEHEISKRGIWVNLSNPKEGISVLAKLENATSEDVYKVALSGGKVTGITSFDGKRVMIDSKSALENNLSPTGRTVYLANPGGYTVNEIRLLDQNMTLKRDGEGKPWVIAEGPFKGYVVSFQGRNSSEVKKLLGFMGGNLEQFGMVLIHPTTKEQKVLLWPNRITSANPEKNFTSKILEFDKSQSTISPMVLTLGSDERWHGSPDALLYISYLAAATHNYDHAKNLLDQMQRESGGNPQVMKQIMQHFLDMPGSSRRNIATRLKAVLQIQNLLRQQNIGVQEPGRTSKTRVERLENLVKIGNLVEKYENFEKVPKATSDDLKITTQEIGELKALAQEGYSDIRERFNPLELNLADRMLQVDSPNFALSKIAKSNELSSLLIAGMKKPPDDLRKLLSNTQPNSELLLNNFFGLWNVIIDEKITPDQLIPLFGKIPASKNFELDATLNFLRCSLIELASQNIAQDVNLNDKKFDLKELYKAHNELPSTKIGLLIAAVKIEKDKIGNPIVAAQLKKVNDMLFSSKATQPIAIRPFEGLEPSLSGERYEQKISIRKMNEAIAANPQLFGQYTTEVAEIIRSLPDNALVNVGEVLEQARTKVNEKLNKDINDTSLSADLHLEKAEAEISRRISFLEKQLKEAGSQNRTDTTDRSSAVDRGILESENIIEPFLIDATGAKEKIEQLEKAYNELKAVFDKATDPLDVADKNELLKGLESVRDQLKALQESRSKIISPDQLKALEGAVNQRQIEAELLAKDKRENILVVVKYAEIKGKLPLALRQKVEQAEAGKISDAELFETLINAYQRFQIQNTNNQSPYLASIEKAITEFLILKTEAQQLDLPAKKLIAAMQVMASKKPFDAVTYEALSAKLQLVISRGAERSRYIEPGTGKLKDAQFGRKYLVIEYRSEPNKIILRPEQRILIESAAKNPNKFYELRMGLGKTSYILPTLMQIWAEQGLLPVGILKDQLLNKGYKELDPATRSVIEQAGVLFSFDVNASSVEAGVLADQYMRLLEVKKDKGYVLTSIHSLASIEQKLVQLALNRGDLLKSIGGLQPTDRLPAPGSPGYDSYMKKIQENMEKLTPEARQLLNLQKEMYWLTKIRNLFIGDKENLGFETQKFADEADDLYSALKEDNLALTGVNTTKVAIHPIVKSMGLRIMENLLKSQDPDAVALKNALLNGTQAGIKNDLMREKYLPGLVKSLLTDPEILRMLGLNEGLNRIPRDQLIKYLCDRDAQWPDEFPKYNKEALEDSDQDRFQKGIGVLKDYIQKALPKALALQQDHNVGVKEKDGLTVGPRVGGEEEAGLVYSDQFDIAAVHLIQYVAKIPDTKFFSKAIVEFREQNAELYEGIESRRQAYVAAHPESSEMSVLEFINLPQNFQDRLNLFKSSVLDKELLSRFERQVSIPNQQLARGNNGGMTGTLNSYVMPDTKGSKEGNEVPRMVEAEVIMRIGMQKVKPKVVIVEDEHKLPQLLAPIIKDPDCKFIISEGSGFGGLNSSKAVEAMRDQSGCEDLNFVYMHPKTPGDPRSDQAVVLSAGETSSTLISRADVVEQQQENPGKMRFYFGAPHSRGVDFGQIEKGSGVMVTGPTTTMSSFGQGVYREREIGEEHTISHFAVLKSQADRICAEQGIAPEDITWVHVINDIRLHTLDMQKGECMKTATDKVTSKVEIAARDITNTLNPAQNESGYWNAANPQRVKDIQTEAEISQVFGDIIVQTRNIQFEALYSPSKEVDLDEKMNGLFAQQIKIIDGLKTKVSEEVADRDKRVSVLKSLDDLIIELTKAKNEFMQNIEVHKQKLPAKASVSGNDTASSVAVVSEAAAIVTAQAASVVIASAESAQTNEVVASGSPDKHKRKQEYRGFRPENFEDLESKDKDLAVYGQYDAPFLTWPLQPGSVGIGRKNLSDMGCSEVFMTPEMKRIFDNFPQGKAPGTCVGYVAVIDNKVMIMSKADYAWIMEEEIEKSRSGVQTNFHNKYGNVGVGVVTFVSNGTFMIPGSTTAEPFIKVDQGAIAPDYNDEKVKLSLVKAKWIMGISEYNDGEMAILNNWLMGLPDANASGMCSFIRYRATDKQRKIWNQLKPAYQV